jgi:hypothetical protein
VRSLLTWDTDERTSLTAAFDYNQDDYPDGTLGLRNSKSWTFGLDGAYQVTSGFSINAFYTYEYQRSEQAGWNYVANAAAGTASPIIGGCFSDTAQKNLNNKIDPCNAWTSQSRDNVHTFGVSARQRGLLGNKLTLGGDLFVTLAGTDVAVQGGNYATIPGTTSLVYIPASDLPTVKSDRYTLRLNGVYSIDKRSAVRLVYIYEKLKTSDFAYQGLQYGTQTTVIPTNEQSPNYTVNVVGISYVYSF